LGRDSWETLSFHGLTCPASKLVAIGCSVQNGKTPNPGYRDLHQMICIKLLTLGCLARMPQRRLGISRPFELRAPHIWIHCKGVRRIVKNSIGSKHSSATGTVKSFENLDVQNLDTAASVLLLKVFPVAIVHPLLSLRHPLWHYLPRYH
jgi:hypothetical protein